MTKQTTDPSPNEQHHVHFNPEDVARVEGKQHKDYPKTHLPEKPHVHFNPEDVARVEGKAHRDYPKTHLPEKPHVHFDPDDVARVEGKPHKDYPKTHKPPEEPHVRFKEEDLKRKENKEHVDFPKTHMPSKGPGIRRHVIVGNQDGVFGEGGLNSAKVKVSKEDFILHLKIVVLCFSLFLLGTWYNSKDPWEELNKPKAKSLQEMLQEEMEKKMQIVDPELPTDGNFEISPSEVVTLSGCNLFLSRSSVGKSGFGVFSVVDLEEGSVVFAKSQNLVVGGIDLPLHSIVLRQHPYFGNVKISENGIVAKRNIQQGEELFLDLNDMEGGFASVYHGILHPSDPVLKDYEKADRIVQGVLDTIPTTMVYEQPKKKMYKQRVSRYKNGKRVPAFDAGDILAIVKESLQEYNEPLAHIIPDSTVKARSMMEAEGSARFISNHRSVDWITSHGLCISGLSSKSSDGGNDTNGGAFAIRSIGNGDIIETAPLYAVRSHEVPTNGNCFESSAVESSVFFCPLSFLAHVKKGDECESGTEECSSSTANARFEWSRFNPANRLRGDFSAEDLLTNPMTDFTIDLIATRDIARNEEVYADISKLNHR